MSGRGDADLERLLAARGAGDAAAALAAALGAPSPPPPGRARLLSPLARALRRNPRDAELRAARGRLLLRLGRGEEAVAELERAARLAPGRSEPRLWLGAARLVLGDCAGAADELDRRLKAAPGDLQAQALRAAAAAGAGDEKAAVAGARAVADAAAAPPELAAGARALLGLLYTRAGETGAAVTAFDAALALHPGAAWLLGLRACARRRAGDRRGAAKDLDAAARREPTAWLLAERAGLREENGDAAGALRDLAAALRLGGASAALLQRRANLLAATGRLDDAAAEALRALSAPDGALARPFAASLARALAQAGRRAAALSVAKRVLRAAPRDPAAVTAYADVLAAAGRDGEAAAVRRRAGLAPAGAPPAPRQALSLAAAGRLGEAERAARAELVAAPGTAAVLVLVEVLLRRGRAGEAAAVLERERPRLPPPDGPDDLARRFRLAVLAADVPAAEAAGEALLDASRAFRHVEVLCRPFFGGEFDFMRLPAGFLDGLFSVLDARVKASPRAPWARFLRLALCALCGATGERDTREADCAALARVPPRYGWMRGLTGQWRLINRRDYAAAERDFRAAAGACEPGDWTSWCFLGETLLCRGREKEAFAALAEARRVVPPGSAADVLAWEGELRLWLGQAAAARATLDKAIRLGAIYAEGWKAGALVLAGRHAEALACADRALARTPHDAESGGWKAEALLRLGRPAEALAETDRVIARYARYAGFHLHAVRGLARRALGDAEGPAEAAREIPAEVLAFVRERTPEARSHAPEALAAALEALLRLSRGVRRGSHETAVWLR